MVRFVWSRNPSLNCVHLLQEYYANGSWYSTALRWVPCVYVPARALPWPRAASPSPSPRHRHRPSPWTPTPSLTRPSPTCRTSSAPPAAIPRSVSEWMTRGYHLRWATDTAVLTLWKEKVKMLKLTPIVTHSKSLPSVSNLLASFLFEHGAYSQFLPHRNEDYFRD